MLLNVVERINIGLWDYILKTFTLIASNVEVLVNILMTLVALKPSYITKQFIKCFFS